MPSLPNPPAAQRGVTLLEQLAAMAVLAVTAGTIVPAVDTMAQRQRLDGASSLLRTDIAHARSMAIARNQAVRLRAQTDDDGACYIVHTGAAQDCSCASAKQATCKGSAEILRSVQLPKSDGVAMSMNSSSMLFDASLGTITPTGTIQLSSRQGSTIRLVVNVMGRVRQCTTTPPLLQLPNC